MQKAARAFCHQDIIGEFDQLDPCVFRAGFAPASEVAVGYTMPF
jgi:hypothetical protein